MKNILAALLFLFYGAASACIPHTHSRCVAPSGDDANNCLTPATACKTIQRGADSLKAADSMTGSGAVYIADGTYDAGARVLYYRFVSLVGNCADPWKVIVSTSAKDAFLFYAEDHAIMIVKCMELEAPNGYGIGGRQRAIIDYQDIRWGSFHTKVSMSEGSNANCAGTQWILAGGGKYAEANTVSWLALGCVHWINESQSFTHFVAAHGSSQISFGGGSFIGPGAANIRGYKGVATNLGALIDTGGLAVPGNSGWDMPIGGGQIR